MRKTGRKGGRKCGKAAKAKLNGDDSIVPSGEVRTEPTDEVAPEVKGRGGNVDKQDLLDIVAKYGEELGQKLQCIKDLMNVYYDKVIEVSVRGEGKEVEGGEQVKNMVKEGGELLSEFRGEVEGRIGETRVEWEKFREQIEIAVINLKEPNEDWENESIESFSGFETSSSKGNDEEKLIQEVGEKVAEESSMTVELVAESIEESSKKCECHIEGGEGETSLEEGFARIERGFEEKLLREMKKFEEKIFRKRMRSPEWRESRWGNRGVRGGTYGNKYREKKVNWERSKMWGRQWDWNGEQRRAGGQVDQWDSEYWENSLGDSVRGWVTWEDISVNRGQRAKLSGGGGFREDKVYEERQGGGNGMNVNTNWKRGNHMGYYEGNRVGNGGGWCARLLSGFEVGTTVDDIANVLRKYGRECDIVHIGTASEHLYSSFVIKYREVDYKVFENDSIWPGWVKCKIFYNQPRIIIDQMRLYGKSGCGGRK